MATTTRTWRRSRPVTTHTTSSALTRTSGPRPSAAHLSVNDEGHTSESAGTQRAGALFAAPPWRRGRFCLRGYRLEEAHQAPVSQRAAHIRTGFTREPVVNAGPDAHFDDL